MSGSFATPAVVIGGLKLLRSFMGTGVPIISVPRTRGDLVHYSRLLRPSGLSVADLQTRGDAYFLERLIAVAERTRCRPVLFYGDDEVLGFIARNRAILQRHFLLALPPEDTLHGCLSKIPFANLAAQAELPVPSSLVLQSGLSAADVRSRVGFPCVIKPDSHVGWNRRKHWLAQPAGTRKR